MGAKIQFFFVIGLPVSQKNRNFALVIELQRHIEILLLDNDCVIVPDFGGFVTHQVSACFSEDDSTFLPPLRMLGFNPQLRINDSLLVQSYATAYDISYPEALRRVESEVAELKDTLQTEGSYTLSDIGTLTVNGEGSYLFEPCEAGVLSPELYGLSTFTFSKMAGREQKPLVSAAKEQAETAPALLEFTGDETDVDERAISIKVSWIRNTVAVAAAVIAFFLMATPVANSDLNTRTMSQLQGNLVSRLMPKDTNAVPAKPLVKDTTSTKVKETAAVTEKPDTALAKPIEKPAAPYCIVLASQVKMSNAEDYVESLHKRGYQEAEVYVNNKIVRVVYGAFQTESEAHIQLRKMNDQEEFAEAWVYKKKSI